MAIGNFHIGIMGNLFSGKTTLMNAMTAEPYRSELPALAGGAELYSFTERVEKDSLTDRCLKLFYQDRVANIFATEVAFLNMRVHQQREIRHLMTREAKHPVIVLEDRPFLDGPEVFVRRMIDTGEMPPAHADLYYTLFSQTLHHERIRLPDLTVYLRTEPDLLEKRRKTRAKDQLEVAQQAFDRYDYDGAIRAAKYTLQQWPLADYAAAFAELPASIRTTVTARWGRPEDDPHVAGGAFRLGLHSFGNVTIGDRCKLQNNVSIYPGVTLEDGVFCGPSCVFTNVLTPRAEIERKNEFLPTLVKRGAIVVTDDGRKHLAPVVRFRDEPSAPQEPTGDRIEVAPRSLTSGTSFAALTYWATSK